MLVMALAALARTANAELAWQAPAQCPPAAQVSSEIDRLLAGSEYPKDAVGEFSLAVTQDARTGKFVVRILRTQGGALQERVVEAADCKELVQAAALAVALAIDPELEPTPPTPVIVEAQPGAGPVAATAASSATPATVPPPPPLPSTPPAQQAPAAVPPPAASSAPAAASAGRDPVIADAGPPSETAATPSLSNPRISAFALATGDSGSMPEAALGVGGGVALMGEATRVQVALELFSSTETEADPSGAYARFGLYRAHVSACYTPFAQRIFLFGCAALQTGVLRAQGRGVADVHEMNRAWLAAGADLLVLGSLADRTWLHLRGGVVRPLIEREYVMNGSSVHQVSSWVLEAALGVEFRFN